MKAMAQTPAEDRPQALHEIKGVLTKFMRMLFPLEFRLDSIANCGPMLAVSLSAAGGRDDLSARTDRRARLARRSRTIYYLVTAAHLAGRHEFGTFKLCLAELPGFEERGETGVEAIDSFVASFSDPMLGGALMRLCESRRESTAELARRYRGLAPRIAKLNRALVEKLNPRALSTMLVRGALEIDPGERPGDANFHRACRRILRAAAQAAAPTC